MCNVATADVTPTVDQVVLAAGQSIGFDDLRYAPALRKVLAVGVARLFIVDPDTLGIEDVVAPSGAESVDADATTIYLLDRGTPSVVAIDAITHRERAQQVTTGSPDYLRVAPTVPEVWVTLPGRHQIEVFRTDATRSSPPLASQVFDTTTLAPLATIDVAGAPEGLTFDTQGHAYTQTGGRIIQIDVTAHAVIGEWETGCGSSHGFPQVDDRYGLVIAGCGSNGGVGITTTTGEQRAGYEAGGRAAILAHDGTNHHLFVRGDPGSTLDILAVCSEGGTSRLARVSLSNKGHAATVDDGGHAWVADEPGGTIFRITDPFPTTE